MAIDKQLGTEMDPNVRETGRSITVPLEPSRGEQIRAAAEVLVNEENLLIDDEIIQPEQPQMSFDANLVDFIDDSVLQKISNDLLSSIKSDKQSRSEWEKLTLMA